MRMETECKLPFRSVEDAQAALAPLDADLLVPRTFEDNVLYDYADRRLRRKGTVLRLRSHGERALLTVKRKVRNDTRHKVREEIETNVGDAKTVDRMLRAIGFVPWIRYQKYRSIFTKDSVEICLDETPVGCFIELEGEPDAIDTLAKELGFVPEQYILASYLALHRNAHPNTDPLPDMLCRTEQP